MITLRYPKYYEQFACIAGACEDTCCAGWEIDIDDESYQKYMQIPGEFGEKIRANIREYETDDEDVYESHGFVLKEDRRCPFLNQDNLCEMILTLGEDAICDVCANTPRNFFEYDHTREISLSPSCAEAGRLLFGSAQKISFGEKQIEEEIDLDESKEELLIANNVRYARDHSITILQDRTYPLEQRIVTFLFYAKEVQACMNEEAYDAIPEIDYLAICQKADAFCEQMQNEKKADRMAATEEAFSYYQKRMESFGGMESIDREWEENFGKVKVCFQKDQSSINIEKSYLEEKEIFLHDLQENKRAYEQEHWIVYNAFLFLIRCLDDNNFWGKAQCITAAFLLVQDMGLCRYLEKQHTFTKEDRVDLTRIYAKEVEHSEVNIEYLEDEFLFEDIYTLEELCKQVLL